MLPKMSKEEFETLKEQVKDLLKKINKNTDPEEVKRLKLEFKDILERANPLIIAAAEGELVQEGFSQEDLMTACDIHLELFKDAIENPQLKVPPEHPIAKFQEEHKMILRIMEQLISEIKEAKSKGSFEAAAEHLEKIKKIANKLMEAESHNVRQENTLFPVLEKHGVEQPPAIMWTEHLEMKEQKKKLLQLLEEKDKYEFNKFMELLNAYAIALLEKFGAHTQKEEHILYEVALEVITDEEWKDIKEGCDELGYFSYDIE